MIRIENRSFIIWICFCLSVIILFGCSSKQQNGVFKVTVADSLNTESLTGRLFVALSPEPEPEPRIAAYYSARRRVARVPFFSKDIETLMETIRWEKN